MTNVKNLCVGRNEAVGTLFHIVNKSNELIFVGDSVREYKVFMYTNSVPTYKPLGQGELIKNLRIILMNLFITLPYEFASIPALEELARYLAAMKLISKDDFNKRLMRMGVAFKDVFAELQPPQAHVTPLKYGPEVFTQHVIPANYEKPVFSNSSIVLKESTKVFLENLCGSSPFFYNVLRGFCRILLGAKEEGRYFQTCIWVSGPPGTMKSTWPNLLKLLVPPSRVQEQSKIITPFTAGQLENCDLLILSDVQTINKDVVGLLKALLGRDPITLQEKFKQDIKLINPNCQVIIVSNYSPAEFRDIADDEGMRNRIIHVEFKDYQKIPPDLQIPTLDIHLKDMISDIFNWAAHAPKELFSFHIRSQYYQSYALKEKAGEPSGMEAFVAENFVYDHDPSAFVAMDDIEVLMREYSDRTGDPVLEDILKRRLPKAWLVKIIPSDYALLNLNKITSIPKQTTGFYHLT